MSQIAPDGEGDTPVDAPASGGREWLGSLLTIALVLGVVAAGWLVSGTRGVERALPTTAAAPMPADAPPPPPVEPVTLRALPPEEAVAINAAVPFSTRPNPAARAFRYAATPAELERAIDCLAAAGYYEAGDDAKGQRAVAQVVINRLRHPAFPKSICGVVFQGSERATGCQFTFTCDGAMGRTPSAAAWERARAVAKSALSGSVYRAVGYATHYHTNWVVPYWSASLDKIAAVDTHLFFRWTGWWGTPGAFRGQPAGGEPAIGQLALLSPAHGSATPTQLADAALGVGLVAASLERETAFLARFDPAVVAKASKLVARDGDIFIVLLDRQSPPDSFAAVALSLCGSREYCKVMGWTQAAMTPGRFPVPESLLRGMSFSYLRNRADSFAKPLWNCAEFKRADSGECMKARAQSVAPPSVAAVKEDASVSSASSIVAPPAPMEDKTEPAAR
ncbi:cell wall hydrolase [Sphingomonas sp. LaA6.9]|uniref:cell wall hydrolase n=1 Tax=Sphingomonas sp. LaA6.9 TaxID=2919914 RepID=UPI001F4F17D2|nr:cell wall hydrolase [Sphingomonas sp. LaA6.9]MCJ8157736.1 cell wall hydrolase [Sphingomonas sp. LaA6.9]